VENFQLKIDEEEFVKFFLGRTSRESFTDFLKAQNKDEILIKKALISFEKLKQDALENKMESNLPLRRYTREFLKKLKAGGYRLAIATSTKRSFTDDIIRELDLEKYFDITVAGDEVKFSKPDPEIYLKAAKKLGVDYFAFDPLYSENTLEIRLKESQYHKDFLTEAARIIQFSHKYGVSGQKRDFEESIDANLTALDTFEAEKGFLVKKLDARCS